ADVQLVERIVAHDKHLGALSQHDGDRRVEVGGAAELDAGQRDPGRRGRGLHLGQHVEGRGVVRIGEIGDAATVGIASRRSSSRLPPRSGLSTVLPVMLLPGRARLATKPVRTASPTPIITMGIVVVAALAASVGGVPKIAIKSTGRRTSSPTAAARRSGTPSL